MDICSTQRNMTVHVNIFVQNINAIQTSETMELFECQRRKTYYNIMDKYRGRMYSCE